MPFARSTSIRLLAGTVSTVLPLSAAIAATSETAAGSEPEMEPIVVTATLGPRTAGESLSSVTVIDEEAIERQQPREFKDLLRSQPGINVIANGSFGKNTSVFTRGTSSESTVFLIDGIRLRSSTSGSAPWQYFPVDLVERVEVVRGPRSSLYGADAVGGVVQAFTHEPGVGGPKGWIEAGVGSFDTRKGAGGVSARAANTRFSLSGVNTETNGTAIVEEGEDKGFRNTAGVAKLAHELDSGGEAGLLLMQSEGNTEFTTGNTDYRIRLVGLRLATPVSAYWDTAFQLSEARDEQDTYDDNWGFSVFNSRARNARWENIFYHSGHELAVGAEIHNETVDSTTEYDEDSRTNAALFSQLRLKFGAADLQLSLRRDDNEAYGTQDTWGAAIGYSLDRHHRARVSVGTSFKAPSFNDLYYPNFGDPDLEPEEAISYEAGLQGRYPDWFWDVAVYQSNVEDLSLPSQEEADSVPEAELRGIEISSGWERDGWSMTAGATFGDYINETTGDQLKRRAERSFRLDIDKDLGSWSLGSSLRAESHRYDDFYNNPERKRLAGFGIWDLRASKAMASDWRAFLTVNNVLDKEYSTAASSPELNYIAAGRTAMLTVRYDIR